MCVSWCTERGRSSPSRWGSTDTREVVGSWPRAAPGPACGRRRGAPPSAGRRGGEGREDAAAMKGWFQRIRPQRERPSPDEIRRPPVLRRCNMRARNLPKMKLCNRLGRTPAVRRSPKSGTAANRTSHGGHGELPQLRDPRTPVRSDSVRVITACTRRFSVGRDGGAAWPQARDRSGGRPVTRGGDDGDGFVRPAERVGLGVGGGAGARAPPSQAARPPHQH